MYNWREGPLITRHPDGRITRNEVIYQKPGAPVLRIESEKYEDNKIDQYNVVWTSQSRNSGESMPCSGGDIGLNVWAENDELLLYMGRAGYTPDHRQWGGLFTNQNQRMEVWPLLRPI